MVGQCEYFWDCGVWRESGKCLDVANPEPFDHDRFAEDPAGKVGERFLKVGFKPTFRDILEEQ